MMKKVLIPTDFSPNAWNAISYGMQLFKDEEVTFYLLHTFTPAAYHVGSIADSYAAIQLQEVVREQADRELKETVNRIRETFPNPKHVFKTITSYNLLVMEIMDQVAEKEIDLILMGTQGATGAKEVFLGTHTAFTIKKVKCPVLAVPEAYHYEGPREVLFPTDFRIQQHNRFFPLLKDLLDKENIRISILNVHHGNPLDAEQKENKAFLDRLFQNNSHEFHIAEDATVPDAVAAFQVKHKINLLVMLHNKHTFFENMLFTPVINQVAFHTNIPFLVIPSEALMEN